MTLFGPTTPPTKSIPLVSSGETNPPKTYLLIYFTSSFEDYKVTNEHHLDTIRDSPIFVRED